MKRHFRPLIAVAVFMAMQLAAGILIALPLKMITNGSKSQIGDPATLTLVLPTLIAGIASVMIISKMSMIDWHSLSRPLPSTKATLAYIVAALLGIVALNIANEFLPLTDLLKDSLPSLATTVMGFLTVGIVGPVCEELVFREALLGGMLRAGTRPRRAIIVAALCFGIIHLNPAQVPFAFAVGLMLGYIYCKTGSIVVPSIIHIINNSASLAFENILSNDPAPFSLVKHLGGSLPSIAIAIACTLACITLLRWQPSTNHPS